MTKNSDNTVTIKVFYQENGIDIAEILRKSLMLFMEKEVRELCQKNSWLHNRKGLIIFM